MDLHWGHVFKDLSMIIKYFRFIHAQIKGKIREIFWLFKEDLDDSINYTDILIK